MWYFELIGKNREVVERSPAVYENQLEATRAGYERVKEKLSHEPPPSGDTVEARIHNFLSSAPAVVAKRTDD